MPKKPWTWFIKGDNQEFATPDALDLIDKMLVYDHTERILPKEAMQHKFFDPVRAEVEAAGDSK